MKTTAGNFTYLYIVKINEKIVVGITWNLEKRLIQLEKDYKTTIDLIDSNKFYRRSDAIATRRMLNTILPI